MKSIKTLVSALALATGTVSFPFYAAATAAVSAAAPVQVQQIRNATAKIHYGGKTFLVDPFLAKKGIYAGFPDTFHSELRNPTVELPLAVTDIMKGVDAVIVTHTHLDHWDGGDQTFISKATPLFVQHEADAKLIRSQGYTNVHILTGTTEFEGVHLTKAGGRHGTEEMYSKKPLGDALGEAMGVVFQASGAKTIYLVDDTVWNATVDDTLAKFKPDVIILNAGDARMKSYTGSIIMGKDDVLHAYQAMPSATIIAVHMDAINHMTLSRKELREHVKQHKIGDRVRIPSDGDILKF
ncbi:MBL fold metallo-hydrolase [Noviherbaspirillum sp. L7-7A]|uniref:MBL fold metallo-hydrolase n=1 Tax=Noviherbaspirillum sp. L7-7A TaxID=2850560 RepID=UPI001C2BC553|nr:MBL fold metallo-hydrolase [Noviherbaspirillum sp. L7-7A]MBV0881412.1 MBL fold metallo-hydrolase [Noviherbaspirillum sp. L7-7A]